MEPKKVDQKKGITGIPSKGEAKLINLYGETIKKKVSTH
jgi:hypothetical protein